MSCITTTKYEKNGEMTFSRSTSATYISGGELKIAAIDEPRFEADGLLIEGGSTNVFYDSIGIQAFSFVSSSISQADLGGGKIGASVVSDATSAVFDFYPSNHGLPDATSDFVSYSFFIDTGVDISSRISVLSFLGALGELEASSVTIDNIKGSLYRVTSSIENSERTSLRIKIDSVVTGENFIFYGFQLEDRKLSTSYIPTSGVATTRGSDSASIVQTSGILTDISNPFTIIFDAYISWDNYTDNSRRMVWGGTSDTGGNFMFSGSNNSDSIQYIIEHDSGTVYLVGHLYSSGEGMYRFALTYDGDTLTSYSNGVQVSANNDGLNIGFDVSSPFYFGANKDGGGSRLNSNMRSFRVFDRALTESEIADFGAA